MENFEGDFSLVYTISSKKTNPSHAWLRMTKKEIDTIVKDKKLVGLPVYQEHNPRQKIGSVVDQKFAGNKLFVKMKNAKCKNKKQGL